MCLVISEKQYFNLLVKKTLKQNIILITGKKFAVSYLVLLNRFKSRKAMIDDFERKADSGVRSKLEDCTQKVISMLQDGDHLRERNVTWSGFS